MQLFNLADDPGEQRNLVLAHPDKVRELISLLDRQVHRGRCTPGEAVSNDRDVTFLPDGISLPPGE